MQIKDNKRIPGPGNNFDLFERLSSYIWRIDREWISHIKPARPESVDLLRKLSGLEELGLDFPEAYKVFLKHMGEDDGGTLGKSLLGETSIDYIIDLYKDIYKYEPDTLNPQYLAFVSTHFGGQISFDFAQPDNPNIVMASDGEFCYFYSENFEKLLFQYAFYQYEELYYPNSISFGGSPNMLKSALASHQTEDILNVVDKLAKENGFEKAWFSDKRHYVGIRDDATFFICKDKTVVGNINGYNEKLLLEFGSNMTSEIGARIQRRNF